MRNDYYNSRSRPMKQSIGFLMRGNAEGRYYKENMGRTLFILSIKIILVYKIFC